MKKLFNLKAKLDAKYAQASGLQKGFTLIEILAVVFIIIIILALVVFSFTFFGRVDGTELTAESKNVESAVLQVALADEDRNIPADGNPTRATATNTLAITVTDADFVNPNDAAVVVEAVAHGLDIAGFTGSDLMSLVRPVDAKRVQKSISGNAEAEEYFVILKKSQLYKDAALASLNGYNDELAGQVFSSKTVIDSDGIYYNGTHVVRTIQADGKEINLNAAGQKASEIKSTTILSGADGIPTTP